LGRKEGGRTFADLVVFRGEGRLDVGDVLDPAGALRKERREEGREGRREGRREGGREGERL
jgi:hypothetical protein